MAPVERQKAAFGTKRKEAQPAGRGRRVACLIAVLCCAYVLVTTAKRMYFTPTLHHDTPQASELAERFCWQFLAPLRLDFPDVDGVYVYQSIDVRGNYWIRFHVVDPADFAAIRTGLQQRYQTGTKCRWDPPESMREWWNMEGQPQLEHYAYDRDFKVVSLEVTKQVVYFAHPDY